MRCTVLCGTAKHFLSKTEMKMNCIYRHGDEDIAYTVSFDRCKSIRLRIKSPDCVEIKMPVHTPFSYAEKTVSKYAEWIVRRRRQLGEELPRLKPADEELYLFGSAFIVIKSAYGQNRREKLHFTACNAYFDQEELFAAALPAVQTAHKNICLTRDTLYVQCGDRAECLKVLTAWRKKSAMAFLPYYYEKLWAVFRKKSTPFLLRNGVKTDFHTRIPPLRIRACRRCFGSCRISPKKQETGIMLSSHLLGMPLEYIEFVILHEFCHLVFPNHSSGFYALFGEVLPAHKMLKSAINAWSRTHNPF